MTEWLEVLRWTMTVLVWITIVVLWILIIAMRKQAKDYGREMARVDWLIRTETTTVVHGKHWALIRAGRMLGTPGPDLRAVIDATMESDNG